MRGPEAVFSGFMVNAWLVATIVAVVAGLVGFFTVLRGSAFAAHAIPNGSFAGAAGAEPDRRQHARSASACSPWPAALGIGLLGRRGRHDVATALALVVMLAPRRAVRQPQHRVRAGALLAAVRRGARRQRRASSRPRPRWPSACALAIAVLYRPLMLSSRARPTSPRPAASARSAMELAFLRVVALATTMTVPVVGTLLIFSLMIGPPAAARSLTDTPRPRDGAVGRDRAADRLGRDRRLLPDQLPGRLLRRHGQRRRATRPHASGWRGARGRRGAPPVGPRCPD